MLLLTAAAQPDYVALAMVLVLAVIIAVMTVRKYFASKNVRSPEPVAPVPEPVCVAPGSAGTLKLHDVEPKTAALLMAIVAYKTGKPLNELRFISIKEVK